MRVGNVPAGPKGWLETGIAYMRLRLPAPIRKSVT